MIRDVNTDKLAKYVVNEQGFWVHKHPLKVFINPILRKIQFLTDRPFIIASLLSSDLSEFYGFKIIRIKYLKN